MPMKYSRQSGFTLIELVIIIVILSILASVGIRQMSSTIETTQYEQTKVEMDQLAVAIRGNEAVYSDGARSDFGYVGDVGALPANLDALVQNPGGYASWDGPYIDQGGATNDFTKDGWGTAYTYQDTMIRSTGSGSNIDKLFASSRAELLNNTVEGYFVDADRTPPTSAYTSTVWIHLIHPNGAGGTTVDSVHPNATGYFSFSNISIGNHTLRAIYTSVTDTVTLPIAVYPKRTARINIVFPADLW